MGFALGVALPPALILLGLSLPASDLARAMLPLGLVASGVLIGRWWAAAPSLVSVTLLALAEEANHRGFGPGTRIGTAIELHSDEFSVTFWVLASAVAVNLPTIGVALRLAVEWLVRRGRRGAS